MRNTDLDNGNDSILKHTNPMVEMLLNMSEEQKSLLQYVAQAQLYLITNMEQIRSSYANFIFEQLCNENTLLSKYKRGEKISLTKEYGYSYAVKMIGQCIISCDSWLVLCNPENGEPSIVADAYAFTDYDIEAYKEMLAAEYMDINSGNGAFFKGVAINMGLRGAKYGGSYGVDWAANQLTQRGNRLGALSAHYAFGNESNRRINSSIRGKKARSNAKMKMYLKSKHFGWQAKPYNWTGKNLASCAASLRKASFSVVGKIFGPPTNIFELNAPTQQEGQEKWMENIIPRILTDYCKKHNNYLQIIKQQFLNQG